MYTHMYTHTYTHTHTHTPGRSHNLQSIIQKLGPPQDPLLAPKTLEDQVDLSHCYDIPTLAEVCSSKEKLYTGYWTGGETEALLRLETYIQKRCKPEQKERNMLLDRTAVSPYVRFGCLSVRLMYQHCRQRNVKAFYQGVFSKLLQRDFFLHACATVSGRDGMRREREVGKCWGMERAVTESEQCGRGFSVGMWMQVHLCGFCLPCILQVENFETMVGNPVCLQLPWSNDEDSQRRWLTGATGYPMVDAAMKQLQQEGFIHHYLRWEWVPMFEQDDGHYIVGLVRHWATSCSTFLCRVYCELKSLSLHSGTLLRITLRLAVDMHASHDVVYVSVSCCHQFGCI